MVDKKIKVISAVIIEEGGTIDHPYYQIKYKQLGSKDYNIDFGSYQKECVEEWLHTYFEVYDFEEIASKLLLEEKMYICRGCERKNMCVGLYDSTCHILIDKVQKMIEESEAREIQKEKTNNVIQFPVNMDEMQRDIMVELLNARKECTEQNLLTARGYVAVIDALFYLVKENSGMAIIPEGWHENENKEGFVDNDAICKVTGNYCSRCTPGPCEHRKDK